MFEFLVCLIFATVVSCGYLGPNNLQFDYNTEYAGKYDNYKPRDYHFDYAVSDPHTGDHKYQWETKNEGVVRGAYSLLEPDGTTRIVEYIADDHGFRAVVKKIGTSIHPYGGIQTHETVETHGHVEPEISVEPEIKEPILENYHTYSGGIENYAHVLEEPKYIQEPIKFVQPIEIVYKVPAGYEYSPVEFGPETLRKANPEGYFLGKPEEEVLTRPAALGIVQVPKEYSYQEAQVLPKEYAQSYEIKLPEKFEVPVEKHRGPEEIPYFHKIPQIYGLTGNHEDDSRYSKEDSGYQGEYSQKVQQVVPLPKREALQKFVIYYPGKQ